MRNKFYHGIIFEENASPSRKSCVIFNNIYCLAPATVLLNSFAQFQQEIKQQSASHDLYKALKSNRLIDTSADQRYSVLQSHQFKVIYEQRAESLFETNAVIVHIFKCRNIWNSFNDILRNFVAKAPGQISSSTSFDDNAGNNRHTSDSSKINVSANELHKLLLSSFVILRLKQKHDVPGHINSVPSEVFTEIVKCLSDGNNGDPSSTAMNTFNVNHVKKLEQIESFTTPFGNECFLNTINIGKIANIFGDNKCLMVASMPLVNGCEGGAVYNKEQELIGIVISTTFNWNQENATLTLVAKFNEILTEFMHQTQITNANIIDELHSPDYLSVEQVGIVPTKLEDHIVMVQCSSNWGSGCFIEIGEVRLIITCAHVLENHGESVQCTWRYGRFSSKVIFKNPHFDRAFDIAILEAPSSIPDKYFTRCHSARTSIGDIVYSSGFPHFTSFAKTTNFLPSIFEGRVTKMSKGVIFSDASVQSGQSGGPMFTRDGSLLGICVSNSKDDQFQLIYPNINMSVPIFDILPVLQKYGQTKGES